MPNAADIKSERFQLRLDPGSKRILERAAGHRHESLSQFVLSSALTAAEEVIRECESVTLKEPDWSRFLDALEGSSEPNAELRRIFARHGADD